MKSIILFICFVLNFSAFAQSNSSSTTVLIFVFEGVQIIDFTAPYETFGQAGYNIKTVSYNTDTFRTQMGLKMSSDYNFENSPDAEILVIPGGMLPHDLSKEDKAVLWLKEKEPNAKYIFTVCNGAFILGSSGFSEGLEVTTNAGMISHLSGYLKGVIPVYDKRFVHDGKFVSAGGLTAGFDAALYIISQINGTGRAQEVANKLEYNWDINNKYVRSKLADIHFSKILDFNPPLRKKVIIYEGNEDYWNLEFNVKRNETLKEFAEQLRTVFNDNNWEIKEKELNGKYYYDGQFTDWKNEKWKIKSEFSETNENKIYNMKLRIDKIN